MVVVMTVLISPKELASKLNVTPQSVTKNIRKWRDQGAFSDGDLQYSGRKVVAVAEAKYRLLYDQTINPNLKRGDGPELPESSIEPGIEQGLSDDDKSTVAKLKLREAAVNIEIKELKLAEAAGRVVRLDMLEEALLGCARDIQSKINRLENKTEKLVIAFKRDGDHGVRNALRDVAFELNDQLARSLMAIAKDAEEHDPLDFD